jgi:catechol 2,3-dioxygenase-like lactoylglutathione lyase family enzyme
VPSIVRVRLNAPPSVIPALAGFYGRTLGLHVAVDPRRCTVATRETTIEFAGRPGAAFYHFALLVPGNRADAAIAWLEERAPLLPDSESGDPVFEFDDWDARAVYVHDPAGNIVELIAHRGIEESACEGPFQPAELVGVSELGLVGDTAAIAARLTAELGLEVWDGTVEKPGRLAFVGERARTLILAPPGRGWLPTGRRAEIHAVDAELAGASPGAIALEDPPYRVSSR